MSSNDKVVYLHKDKEGVVRYVGSGTIERAFKTWANSKRGEKYAQYVEANGKLEVKIVAEGLSKVQAEDLERELYDKHKDTVLNCSRPNSVKEMTKEMFEQHLYYDETSKSCLRWKTDRLCGNHGSVKMKAGSEAGSLRNVDGYYQVNVQGKFYRAHRIVAVLCDLEVGGLLIDHIDRNRANNKIENLRVVTPGENMQNISMHKLSSRNTSGTQGVQYDKHHDRWIARWYENGDRKQKSFAISQFTSSEEAFNAAVEYRKKMVNLHYSNKE